MTPSHSNYRPCKQQISKSLAPNPLNHLNNWTNKHYKGFPHAKNEPKQLNFHSFCCWVAKPKSRNPHFGQGYSKIQCGKV